jgi:hypothetical protein
MSPQSGAPIGPPQAPRGTPLTLRHTGPLAIRDNLKIFHGGSAFGLAALPPHTTTLSGVNRWLDPRGKNTPPIFFRPKSYEMQK